ncbi:MAG: phosphatidate cytidylyltransferase [Syntrophomonas sp.]
MFKTRALTAVAGIPLLLGILYYGGVYWTAFFVVLGIISLYEFYRMISYKGHEPLIIPGYLLVLLLMFSGTYPSYATPVFYMLLSLVVIYFVLSYPRIPFADVALSLLGSAYIGFLLSFAIRIKDLDQAFIVILLAFILTWSSDIGGYLFGTLWGKHKMTPLLSPGKTWEGALGALLLTIGLLIAFSSIIELEKINYAYLLVLGILASILAQFGDLFMSGVKRYCGVKDTGSIIPGHGGVLDRFDAFLLVVPLVYYFFQYVA